MKDAPHLLHVFSTFVPAGPEMRTVRMINAFGDEFRHSILAMDGRTEAREFLAEEVPAQILEPMPRAGTRRTVKALRMLFERERPDLVLSYNWGAFDSVFATRLSGLARRHLHHEDGFNKDEAKRFKARRVWTRRLLLPGVGKVIVPSGLLVEIATGRWKLKERQVALVPNGIEPDAFAPRDGNAPLRAELGIPDDAPVIGFVGHLRPVKNTERLVRAVAALPARPAARLLVLGEGPERERIEVLVGKLRLTDRVHLVGHRGDTAPWYRMMDVFAISSDSEQMPVALLEAMAAQLPVASTDVGDVRRMLPWDQGRFLVPLDDEEDCVPLLTRALAKLLEDGELRLSLGAANRARVEERYTFDSMLATYRELYEAALGVGKNR